MEMVHASVAKHTIDNNIRTPAVTADAGLRTVEQNICSNSGKSRIMVSKIDCSFRKNSYQKI